MERVGDQAQAVAPDAVEQFHKSEREVQAQEEKQVPGCLVRQDGPKPA